MCSYKSNRGNRNLEKLKKRKRRSSNQEKMMRRICQKMKYIKSECAISTLYECEEKKRCGSEEKWVTVRLKTISFPPRVEGFGGGGESKWKPNGGKSIWVAVLHFHLGERKLFGTRWGCCSTVPAQQTDDAERSESLCLCDQLRGTDSKLLVSRHLVGRIKLIKPGDKQIGAFGKRVQELLMMSSLLFYIHKFQ